MSLETIIKEALTAVITREYIKEEHPHALCLYHHDTEVRSVIHGIMRAVICSPQPHYPTAHRFIQKSAGSTEEDEVIRDSHIISPCYRPGNPRECRHAMCPYVIAHSIYLWVGAKRGTISKQEFNGVGCVYIHTLDRGGMPKAMSDAASPEYMNARAFVLRSEVFEILKKNYGNEDFIESAPISVISIIRRFYDEVIRKHIANNPKMTDSFTARDITAKKIFYARIYKSSDEDLFIKPKERSDDTEEEPTTVEKVVVKEPKIDDLKIFPPVETAGDKKPSKAGGSRKTRVSLYPSGDNM
jgi:hypothetical protein